MQSVRAVRVALLQIACVMLVLLAWPESARAQLPATIDLATRDEDVLVFGAATGDILTGYGTMVVGDLNGDGVDDLILSAPEADGPGDARNSGGEAYVYFGGPTLAGAKDVAGILGSQPDVIIYGATAGDSLTLDCAIAAGDVNGDLIDDLVLGACPAGGPGEMRYEAGEAYIIYGSATLPATIDLANGDEDVLVYGATGGDHLTGNGAVVLGDVNGDGLNDIVLGAYGASGPGDLRSEAGEAYVIYGSANLPDSIDLANGDEDVTVYGATAQDYLTRYGTVALADVNGDGLNDIFLGANRADGPGNARPDAGEAYIIYGSASLPATINLGAGDEDVTIYGATAQDYLTRYGIAIAGDVNGDGLDDIVLGTYGADGPGNSRDAAGEAYIIYGAPDLPGTLDLAGNDEDVTIYGATAQDLLTRAGSIVVGDVDGDGLDDIVLGAQGADGPGDGRSTCGEAYIIYGSAILPGAIDLDNGDEDVIVYGPAADGLTSTGAIVLGDINGDGLDDTILGEHLADGPGGGRDDAGKAYVVFGSSTALSATVRQTDHDDDPLPEHYHAARTVIDYGSGSSSLTTVTLTRDHAGVSLPDMTKVADVHWQVTTDRTNFSATLTFHYLSSELAGINEPELGVFSSPTLGGIYTRLATTVDAGRNRATTTGVTGLSHFIILDATDDDGDGLPDTFETDTGTLLSPNDTGTDPDNPDTDDDGMPDGWEVDNQLDPHDDGSVDPDNGPTGDPDEDEYSNLGEYHGGTDPQDPDSFPVPATASWALAVIVAAVAVSTLVVRRRRRRAA